MTYVAWKAKLLVCPFTISISVVLQLVAETSLCVKA